MVNYHIQNYQIINRKAFKRIRWDQSYLRFSSNLRSSNNFDRFEDNGCYSDLSSPCITTRRTRHGDKWNSKRFVVVAIFSMNEVVSADGTRKSAKFPINNR